LARFSRGRIRAAALTSEEADRVLGDITDFDERYDQAWLVGDRRRYAGHESVWHALYLLPGGGLLRVLRVIPGFRRLSHRVYRWVADRRKSSCRLDGHAAGQAGD